MRKIAILGPAGSNAHLATTRLFDRVFFKEEPEIEFVKKQTEIFDLVLSGEVEFGLVAILNGKSGLVDNVIERWVEGENEGLTIYKDIDLRIVYNLLMNKETTWEDGDTVLVSSHPETLKQCKKMISGAEATLDFEADIRKSSSTSWSAQLIASEPNKWLAIANELAGEIYGLETVLEGMQDVDTFTRFQLIGKPSLKFFGTRNRKATILVHLENEPNALKKIVDPFGSYGINMEYIVPVFTGNELIFYIELREIGESKFLNNVLSHIEITSKRLEILGNFPVQKAKEASL